MAKRNVLWSLAALVLLLSACAPEGPPPEREMPAEEPVVETGFEPVEEAVRSEAGETPSKPEKKDSPVTEEALKALGVNEMGRVMILMYHGLADEEKDYVRSRENFAEDLRLLYEKGYRPILLSDYIDGHIDVPLGKTPVVITFDDGNLSDFKIIETEAGPRIDPACAVGILEAFSEAHPEFDSAATFFLFGANPFRQREWIDYKLNYLVENGYELGSHSYGHENLSTLTPDGIMETLGKIDKYLTNKSPKVKIRALALPFGARPKDGPNREALESGTYEGHAYRNEAILAVGWQPERSPISLKADFGYLNRVHGSNEEFGIRYWLDYFDAHPEARYVSDGDPAVFTIESGDEEQVSRERLGDRSLRLME